MLKSIAVDIQPKAALAAVRGRDPWKATRSQRHVDVDDDDDDEEDDEDEEEDERVVPIRGTARQMARFKRSFENAKAESSITEEDPSDTEVIVPH